MFEIVQASENHLKRWDNFIDQSVNGTIFHYQKFLAYHGDKFKNKENHLVVLDGTNPIALISLAIDKIKSKKIAKSPYGGSYGGFVLARQLSYHEGKALVECFIKYLKKAKIDEFKITMPPAFCTKKILDTFYFNLLESGFKSVNRDISSAVCFTKEPIEQAVNKRARNMARKAQGNKLRVEPEGNIDDFFRLMAKTYKKHGARPTHTIEEFKKLMALLPGKIYLNIAYKEKTPIAGIGDFVINDRVNSSFYFCQDPEYQNYQGLSLLVMETLKNSQKKGYQYFDFGTSSVNMMARENVFLFKESFDKSGFFRETFQWKK